MIIFDLDNTLLNRTTMLRDYLLADGLGEHLEQLEQADRLGYPPQEPFFELYSRLAGVDMEVITSRFFKRFGEFAKPDQGVLSMLDRLAKGDHGIALLTNGSDSNQMNKIRHAGLEEHFGGRIFVSENIGVSKPSPEAYECVLSAMSVEAKDCVFVGDHPRHDIAGAQRCGMRTCWVSLGRNWPDELERPTWVIEQIVDFEAISEFL